MLKFFKIIKTLIKAVVQDLNWYHILILYCCHYYFVMSIYKGAYQLLWYILSTYFTLLWLLFSKSKSIPVYHHYSDIYCVLTSNVKYFLFVKVTLNKIYASLKLISRKHFMPWWYVNYCYIIWTRWVKFIFWMLIISKVLCKPTNSVYLK